jgi:copper chaperone CopZ
MKTSVIEVHDMLSVLSVDEVEKRIGNVPGVESVTVNYAAGNATARYDETRLAVADIKSAVRQSGYESVAPAAVSAGEGRQDHTAPGTTPSTAVAAAPKPSPGAPTPAPTSASASAAPTSPPASTATPPASAAPVGDGQQGKPANKHS